MTECYDYTKLNEIIIFQGSGDIIELSREGKYINLIKPSEIDKRYYRFDLQKKQFQRINFYKTVEDKVTDVKTENITSWFKDCTLKTKDLHFGRLIIFAKYHSNFHQFSSPVRFVEQLGDRMIMAIEQWESLGFIVKEINDFFSEHLANRAYYALKNKGDLRKEIYLGNIPRTWGLMFYSRITILPSELSKPLLNYVKENYKEINQGLLFNLKQEFNNGEYRIQKQLKALGETPEFTGIFHFESQMYGSMGNTRWLFGTSNESRRCRLEMIKLIQEYNLNPEALCRWIKKQKNIERNDIGHLFGNNHYRDYLRIEKELKNGNQRKMNKYPENFRTTFHRLQMEEKAKRAEINLKKFKQIQQDNQTLEHTGKNYIIKIPQHPKEIDQEADQLDHCVRTYIKPMTEGRTLILFCRNKKTPNTPLVTLEVKKNTLTQAYGKNDSRPDNKILDYLKTWTKTKNIKIGCWNDYLNR